MYFTEHDADTCISQNDLYYNKNNNISRQSTKINNFTGMGI